MKYDATNKKLKNWRYQVAVNRRRGDNTMEEKTTGQTIIYKTLHRKLKITWTPLKTRGEILINSIPWLYQLLKCICLAFITNLFKDLD